MNRIAVAFMLFFVGMISCARDTPESEKDPRNSGKVARRLQFQQIRQVPNFSRLHEFTESTSFNSDKLPNIYFIFFDTLRPDYALKHSKSISSFFNRNLSFEYAYGTGTATNYSTFSLFHSNPAFLTYGSIPSPLKKTEQYGSVFMKILHKLGYQMNIYGFDWHCAKATDTGTSWERFLISYFSWDTNLLERCAKEPAYDKLFEDNRDKVMVDELKQKLPSVVKKGTKNFSMIGFYNNHNPYHWEDDVKGISKNIKETVDWTAPVETTNAYVNSVLNSNKEFSRLLATINNLPGSEEAVIVLLSDHGERMFEPKGDKINGGVYYAGHGGLPYEEAIRILLSFQFTKKSLHNKKTDKDTFASIMDVFPTLMDYIGLSPQVPKKWVAGRSLLSEPRKSILAVQSNQANPTRQMVLENRQLKAWIEVGDEDFYRASGFDLVRITDLDDQPVSNSQNICFNKSDDQCKEALFSAFPEALSELFPNLQFVHKESATPPAE